MSYNILLYSTNSVKDFLWSVYVTPIDFEAKAKLVHSVVSTIQVSYSLLIFFCGMFITVEGFNRTGIPSAFWELMEPYAKIDHAAGIAVLAVVILVLSNLASNVPTGL